MLSTMTEYMLDANIPTRITELGQRVLNGGQISRDEALWLLDLESSADIFDLLSWAIRHPPNKVPSPIAV